MYNKIQNILIHEISHEGWQRKSSVERSGTEIAANDLTRSFYEGACPNKKILNDRLTNYKWRFTDNFINFANQFYVYDFKENYHCVGAAFFSGF